jgi:hypothetical protein
MTKKPEPLSFGGPFSEPANADDTRRLEKLWRGTTIGNSIRRVRELLGISTEPARAAAPERGRETLDRTEVEAFLTAVDQVKQQYAQEQRDPQATLQEFEGKIAQARQQLEAEGQAGLRETLTGIYQALRRTRDSIRSTEVRSALDSALRRAPLVVRTAAQGGQQQGGQ